ncbi:MAG TPA: polyprenol monophosphomannose synthase, partial [Candidatus Peribacteria bacterium]|nr:polyprenol monophosphomannose synthase [Candidatus Peribacteria bacterium]
GAVLTLVLPTYNESANLPGMLAEITRVLGSVRHEIIVVDDNSPDGTWKLAEELRGQYPSLKVLRRTDKRGLSSAVVDGFLMGSGDVLAAMDADGQHDCSLLVRLYEKVKAEGGIAIGSRYVKGGDVGEWDGGRARMSKMATQLAMWVLRRPDAAAVKDPMSGFFAIDRELFLDAQPRLIPKGFKILLDILVHVRPGTAMHELPMQFGVRRAGESKLDWKVQLQYLEYLYDVTLGRVLSLWALLFSLTLLAVLGVLAVRLLPLLPLYTQQSIRPLAAAELQQFAHARGWLVSDLSIRSIDTDSMTVVYATHPKRSHDQLCVLPLASARLPQCVNL